MPGDPPSRANVKQDPAGSAAMSEGLRAAGAGGIA
jgi:hypothetical protein